jgi:hypothetical protein
MMSDLNHWKEWALVAEDKNHLLEKTYFILKESKKTKLDGEPQDIRHLKTELMAISNTA